MKRWSVFAAGLVFAALCIAGRPGVRVEDAWARAIPAVAPVAGGFLTVVNEGGRDDRLLRVESGIAQRIEIHEMRNADGVMRMRLVSDGLPLPAHGRLELKPGGYHLMLIQPTRALREGDRFEAVLVFQRAGKRKAVFEVRGLGAE